VLNSCKLFRVIKFDHEHFIARKNKLEFGSQQILSNCCRA